MKLSHVLPLPELMLRPFTALIVAAVHVYLGVGHLSKLAGGDIQWTHIWKGCGALAGAYVFAALATRGLALSGAAKATLRESNDDVYAMD